MEVMMMIGRYAGEIRDVHPFYGRGLIERGEAIDPNMPIVAEPEVPAQTLVQEVRLLPVPVKKRGGRG